MCPNYSILCNGPFAGKVFKQVVVAKHILATEDWNGQFFICGDPYLDRVRELFTQWPVYRSPVYRLVKSLQSPLGPVHYCETIDIFAEPVIPEYPSRRVQDLAAKMKKYGVPSYQDFRIPASLHSEGSGI